MSDLHIDDFYRDTGKILAALFAQFPRQTTLFVEDISGPDTPDEFGLHSPRHEACLHTMLWLAQTGYLKYESLVRQEALDQVVLTHVAFLALTAPAYALTASVRSQTPTDQSNAAMDPAVPSPVRATESLYIHRIRHELKYGTSYSLAEVVRSFMKSTGTIPDIRIY